MSLLCGCVGVPSSPGHWKVRCKVLLRWRAAVHPCQRPRGDLDASELSLPRRLVSCGKMSIFQLSSSFPAN